ncbi:MAG TPA: LysE family transporter [Alphaproteobacteria bacterium]|nr:LysE family transporter [Alphaproteobacteria bacterium]
MNDLPGFVLAGLALTGSPGPANFGLAAAGAAFGLRRGLGLAAGIIVGVQAVMLLTASGLTGLILAQPALGPAVQILAAAYMAYLAWKIATAPPLAKNQAARPPSFGAGLFLGIGNPKSYAAMSALYSGFTLAVDRPLLDVGLKMLVLFAMVLAVAVAWLLLGSALTRWFRDPATNRAINIAMALLLVASVAFAFLR